VRKHGRHRRQRPYSYRLMSKACCGRGDSPEPSRQPHSCTDHSWSCHTTGRSDSDTPWTRSLPTPSRVHRQVRQSSSPGSKTRWKPSARRYVGPAPQQAQMLVWPPPVAPPQPGCSRQLRVPQSSLRRRLRRPPQQQCLTCPHHRGDCMRLGRCVWQLFRPCTGQELPSPQVCRRKP
jgi:hypothetical protein